MEGEGAAAEDAAEGETGSAEATRRRASPLLPTSALRAAALAAALEVNRSLITLRLAGCGLHEAPEEAAPAEEEAPAAAAGGRSGGRTRGGRRAGGGGARRRRAAAEEGAGAPPAPAAARAGAAPLIGALLGGALASAARCSLQQLDVSANALGDAGTAALVAGVKGVRSLRARYLRGCCGAAALAEVAAAVEAHGAIVLCDLHAADAEEAAAETAKAAAKAVAVAAAGGGAKGALLVDVFDSMDVDGSGTVDIAEYRSAVGNETMRAFFAYIDAQGVADGFLTREEWAKGMGLLGANMSTAQYESELRAMLAAGAGAKREARLAGDLQGDGYRPRRQGVAGRVPLGRIGRDDARLLRVHRRAGGRRRRAHAR